MHLFLYISFKNVHIFYVDSYWSIFIFFILNVQLSDVPEPGLNVDVPHEPPHNDQLLHPDVDDPDQADQPLNNLEDLVSWYEICWKGLPQI